MFTNTHLLARRQKADARCLMVPTSPAPCRSDGWEWRGGATPPQPLRLLHTQMSRLIRVQKKPQPHSHQNTLHPPKIALPVSSLSNDECIALDETEWEM